MAYSYDSVKWTTSGNGQFSAINILDPVYTPSLDDIAAGQVSLTLTAYALNGVDTTNTLLLTIAQAPVVHAGNNESVCKGTSLSIDGSSAIYYTSLLWTTTGDGTFNASTSLHPVYTPGVQDMNSGSVKLFIAAEGNSACPVITDSLQLTILAPPAVELGKDTLACANTSVLLNATSAEAASYLWLPSNKTTPTISVDSAGIGLHSKMIKVLVTGTNGCVTRDSVTVSFKICGGINELEGIGIEIYPNPSSGTFTLELKSEKPEMVELALLTSTGKVVYRMVPLPVQGTASRKIDLGDFASGTYLLQLSNSSGTTVRKLILQK
jgi:hypothetical protein